jgi:ABC-type protease/lipase transport system fused ATPase/permease subunit
MRMKENRSTILIITHKQSILQTVDKLAVLANGQLSLYGPKEAVIAKLNQNAQQQQQAAQQAAAAQKPAQPAVPKMTDPGE